MSYDISFKVKIEGINKYYPVCESANITWNLRDMIVNSTGLEWKNEESNGLVKGVIPYIERGYRELLLYPENYKQYEAENGWGTVSGCRNFFKMILNDWENFCEDYDTKDLKDVVTFWIE